MTERRGLLAPAYTWSIATAVIASCLWFALAIVAWTKYSDRGVELLNSSMRHAVFIGLAAVALGSLMVHLVARVIRDQRRLAALVAQPARGYAEGFADGLARRPAAAGRHLTVVDGPDAS